MSTFTAVLLAMWLIPIIGVVIAYFRLSRRITREVAALTQNRAVNDRIEARRLVKSPQPHVFDVPATVDQETGLHVEHGSVQVDVPSMQAPHGFLIFNN